MSEIQIISITDNNSSIIGVSGYPKEQSQHDILGPDLRTIEDVDLFIDDLIRQLNSARKEINHE